MCVLLLPQLVLANSEKPNSPRCQFVCVCISVYVRVCGCLTRGMTTIVTVTPSLIRSHTQSIDREHSPTLLLLCHYYAGCVSGSASVPAFLLPVGLERRTVGRVGREEGGDVLSQREGADRHVPPVASLMLELAPALSLSACV